MPAPLERSGGGSCALTGAAGNRSRAEHSWQDARFVGNTGNSTLGSVDECRKNHKEKRILQILRKTYQLWRSKNTIHT